MPSMVVLPAPFEPSRPVTPWPLENVARLGTGVALQCFTRSVASTTVLTTLLNRFATPRPPRERTARHPSEKSGAGEGATHVTLTRMSDDDGSTSANGMK